MIAEIICVGTELLMGYTVNTNAARIAEELVSLGISSYYQSVVGDNEDRLTELIKLALTRSDIVILSGGLGPTDDDITKEVAAKCMGKELVFDSKAFDEITAYFKRKGQSYTENNRKQAFVPEGSKVIYNNNGTAPGIIMEENGKIIIMLPGPPAELIPMLEDEVRPYLISKSDSCIFSKMVKICGIGESEVETQIKDLVADTNPTVATYAKTGEVHIRVTGSGENEKAAKQKVKPVVKELKGRFGANIYSTDDNVTLEEVVVDLLIKNNLTVATAESCTGGLVAARIINVSGASEVIKEGIVTYSNKAKHRRLGVKKSTLEKHTAVSEQAAKEMLKGILFLSKADMALAVTGYAGPGGGTEDKPTGCVFIGCSVFGRTSVKRFDFKGNRAKVRESATTAALNMLRMNILEYVSEQLFN